MRVLKGALLAVVVMTAAAAQSADALLSDSRLTVHTLLREDVFAGYMSNNVDRLAKAEQNIEVLLKERPDQRANLLAWKSGASMYRAVRAHEAGKPDEFGRHFAAAVDGFAAAAKLESGNDGVAAVTGGTLSIFADRLPEKHRAAAWSQAYDAYSILWKQQGAGIEQLPVHFKGEDGSRERLDHQSHVQELPQFGTPRRAAGGTQQVSRLISFGAAPRPCR